MDIPPPNMPSRKRPTPAKTNGPHEGPARPLRGAKKSGSKKTERVAAERAALEDTTNLPPKRLHGRVSAKTDSKTTNRVRTAANLENTAPTGSVPPPPPPAPEIGQQISASVPESPDTPIKGDETPVAPPETTVTDTPTVAPAAGDLPENHVILSNVLDLSKILNDRLATSKGKGGYKEKFEKMHSEGLKLLDSSDFLDAISSLRGTSENARDAGIVFLTLVDKIGYDASEEVWGQEQRVPMSGGGDRGAAPPNADTLQYHCATYLKMDGETFDADRIENMMKVAEELFPAASLTQFMNPTFIGTPSKSAEKRIAGKDIADFQRDIAYHFGPNYGFSIRGSRLTPLEGSVEPNPKGLETFGEKIMKWSERLEVLLPQVWDARRSTS